MEKQALPNDALPSTTVAVTTEGRFPDPETKRLRAALAELLLSGALILSDVSRAMGNWSEASQVKQSEERLRKALEVGREALS